MEKSSVDEIRRRFDNDVERFSNLETGQVSTVDAALSLELITGMAEKLCPTARTMLDIGCGAGNYTLKMLERLPGLDCTLADLSRPMLDRALERVAPVTTGRVTAVQGDIRTVELPRESYDIILAGAVLHHLRDDRDWETVFGRLYRLLEPGGCLMVSDLVTQETPLATEYFTGKYVEYLTGIGGEEYARQVIAYIGREDTPRSLNYQLNLMKAAGFSKVEVLHKHICFAAYCGIR